MQIAIAGAGHVGRSIARELIDHRHEVLLIEKDSAAMKPDSVPDARWVNADACELASLEDVSLEDFDVAIAATGDDKANLVHTLLAKTEFGVPRTVGRVNHPGNEWMFDDVWGVDVSVSTPRLMCALVEEAVTVGDLVRLFSFRDSDTDLLEITLPADSWLVGRAADAVDFGPEVVLTAVVVDGTPVAPRSHDVFGAGDGLVFLASRTAERRLANLLHEATDDADSPDDEASDDERHDPAVSS